jgi:hypothetical protein
MTREELTITVRQFSADACAALLRKHNVLGVLATVDDCSAPDNVEIHIYLEYGLVLKYYFPEWDKDNWSIQKLTERVDKVYAALK